MNTIQKLFKDFRPMNQIGVDKYKVIDEEEIIICKLNEGDFSPKSLAECVELAENEYEKENCPIKIYVIMDPFAKVTVKEMEIKSPAIFTIKLACLNEDPIRVALKAIGEKIVKKTATEEDIDTLKMLPLMCKPMDRTLIRNEVFQLLSMLD